MDNNPVIVSACLIGLHTRYDGKNALNEEVRSSLKGRLVVPVCPEQLGGLPTPRPKAAITNGDGMDVLSGMSRVMDEEGQDITAKFIKGAEETLRIAILTGAREAYLKEKSPSCGSSIICRDNECVKGMGVTTALLVKEGLAVKGF